MGVFAVSDKKRNLIVALILGLPALGMRLATFFAKETPLLNTLSPLAVIPFWVFVTAVVLSNVLKSKRVEADTVYGASSVYLLIGITWAMAFSAISRIQPDAVVVYGDLDNEVVWSDIIYFSFTTLTTLGYGDITPATSHAKSLPILEAITGVLYVAILIARIVGLYILHSNSKNV